MAHSGYIQSLAKGIRERSTDFRFNDFANLTLPIPQIEEQNRIVDFLDRITSDIDQAIAKKQRLIELLNEQKAILINRAITKGLNPNVSMRDSGSAVIGQVPKDWKKIKLKYCVDLLTGFAFNSSSYSVNSEDIPLLRGINVNPRLIKWDETVYWDKNRVKDFSAYLLQDGDVIIGMDRPWISSGIRVARISSQDLPCLLLQRVARMRAINPLSQNYLELILHSKAFHFYFEPMLTGISVPHISPEQIKSFEFFIPKDSEQNEIYDFVSQISQDFESAKMYELKGISVFEEMKSVLIANVVTGKFKV